MLLYPTHVWPLFISFTKKHLKQFVYGPSYFFKLPLSLNRTAPLTYNAFPL